MKSLLKSALVLAALSVPSLAMATTYELDPNHTAAQFSVKHMMMSYVHGQFSKVTGTLNVDDKDITKSTVSVTIDANSVDTRNERRDGHLRSPDFLWVEKYPNITFVSKKVEKAADGKLKVTGNLTIRDVTKEVVMDVDGLSPELKDQTGKMRVGAMATTKLNRKDYGLNWNMALEAGGVLVGDDVNVTIEMEAIKKEATAAPAPATPAKGTK